VAFTSWALTDAFSMTLWQFVQATSRDSWGLPSQKSRADFWWHWRQTAFRCSTGVGSFLLKVMSPPAPFPPPAST